MPQRPCCACGTPPLTTSAGGECVCPPPPQLPFTTTEEELLELFSTSGALRALPLLALTFAEFVCSVPCLCAGAVSASVFRRSPGGKSLGRGFVVFDSVEAATKALGPSPILRCLFDGGLVCLCVCVCAVDLSE